MFISLIYTEVILYLKTNNDNLLLNNEYKTSSEYAAAALHTACCSTGVPSKVTDVCVGQLHTQ